MTFYILLEKKNHLKANKKMFVKVLGTLRLLSKCSFEFMNLNLMNLLLEMHRKKNVNFLFQIFLINMKWKTVFFTMKKLLG